MKIQLSNGLTLSRDKFQYILQNGNKYSYHATLEQVATKIANMEIEKLDVDSLPAMVSAFNNAIASLTNSLMDVCHE